MAFSAEYSHLPKAGEPLEPNAMRAIGPIVRCQPAHAGAAQALVAAREWAARAFDRAGELDRSGGLPVAELDGLRRAGLLAAPVPAEEGGLGLGTDRGMTADLLDVLSAIGRGNLSLGRLYEGHVNALWLINQYGTAAQRHRAASDILRRAMLSAVWNTEGPDGVVLERHGGGWRLSGAKTFASGAGLVTRAVITARDEQGGWQMCLVPLKPGGVRIDPSSWSPLGMRASGSFRIDLGGIELGAEDLIGNAGDYHRLPGFFAGCVRFAAVQLGGAAALVGIVRDHLRATGRADDPYQIARAAKLAIGLETGRLWLQRAGNLFDAATPESDDRLIAYANLARSVVERSCLDAIEHASRSIGVQGMLQPHDLERVCRDLMTYLRQPAPDAALASAGRYVLASEGPADGLWL
jgi:alkylation response protein AidB-like acyl-CoA dehydrogenase